METHGKGDGASKTCQVKTYRNPNKAYEAKRKQDDGWGGDGRHGYMKEKERKLEEQFLGLNDHCDIRKKSDIFSGVCIFVNGYTNPSSDHLKQIMADHGGHYQHYYSMRSCTHIIATNLPDTKVKDLRNEKVVHPDWILESVKAGICLPIHKYQLYSKVDCTKKSAFTNFRKPADYAKDIEMKDHSVGNRLYSVIDNSANEVGRSGDLFGHCEEQGPNCDKKSASFLSGDYNDICKKRSHFLTEQDSTKTKDVAVVDEGSAEYDGNSLDKEGSSKASEISQVPMLTKHDYSSALHTKGMGKAGDPGFMSDFYSNSRLHHLSMWKNELRRFATMIHRAASKNGARKMTHKKSKRCIMHIDMDSFFVSVALKERPELIGKPVAVCHAYKGASSSVNMNSMSEIASCSYEARSMGVRNGMFVGTARVKCPALTCVPYYFESYRTVSQKFYEILVSYTSEIEAVSCDEALLDISDLIDDKVSAIDLASKIRKDVQQATGCTASAGIASNILLARMATRRAKPNGQFHLQKNDITEFLESQNVSDLPGVGYSLSAKLTDIGIHTCGELKRISLYVLQGKFGPKTGQSLFNYCRGIDDRKLKTDHDRQSVSAEINYGIRFTEQHESDSFLGELANEVHERLKVIGMKGSHITLKLMVRAKGAPEPAKHMGHGICDSISKSVTISRPVDDSRAIAKEAINLLQQLNVSASDIRGMGIQVSKLVDMASSSKSIKKIDFSMARPLAVGSSTFSSSSKGGLSENIMVKEKGRSVKGKGLVKKRGRKPGRHSIKAIQANLSSKADLTTLSKVRVDSHALKNHFLASNSTETSEPPLPSLDFSPIKHNDHKQVRSFDLPPVSEIDPTVFRELPDDVKESIIEAYKQRNQALFVSNHSLRMPSVEWSPSSRSKRFDHEFAGASVSMDTKMTGEGIDAIEGVHDSLRKTYSQDLMMSHSHETSKDDQRLSLDVIPEGNEAMQCKIACYAKESTDVVNSELACGEELLSESRIDPEVMEALPENLRTEVLMNIKLQKRRQGKPKKRNRMEIFEDFRGVHEGDDIGKRKQGCKSVVDIRGSEFDMISSKHQPSVCTVTNGIEASEAISEKVQPHPTIKQGPSLCGKTRHGDVKMLIKEWISSTDDPLSEDCDEVKIYLQDLVYNRDMEQAFLLLKLLKRLSIKSTEWTCRWKEYELEFENLFMDLYGAKLYL